MDLFDSSRQLADKFLPKKHQTAATALLFVLSVVNLLPNTATESAAVGLKRDAAGFERNAAGKLQPFPLPFSLLLPAANIAKSTSSQPADSRFITEVKPGDNLSVIFKRAGLKTQDVYRVANSSEDAGVLSNLFPGNQLAFGLTPDNALKELKLIKSPLESHLFTLNAEGGYDYRQVLREAEVRQNFKAITIKDSLFMSAQRGGLSAQHILELAGMFGGVIDFMLDLRQGDNFNVLFEEKYLDGQFVGHGAILGAQFSNQGRVYTALRYQNSLGEVGYFNTEGESMRKAFLRNPVDFTRISSDFSLNRRHPILNTIRAHKGTDYAAPNGTPVVATSEGVVTWAARNGSFGKLVVIQHGSRYESKYAHLSDYAPNIKKGMKVKQGQVIGYVGATGAATGPHLHYEFLMDGAHRNWRTIHDQLPKAVKVPAEEMALFQAQSKTLLALLDTHSRQIAQLESGDLDQTQ